MLLTALLLAGMQYNTSCPIALSTERFVCANEHINKTGVRMHVVVDVKSCLEFMQMGFTLTPLSTLNDDCLDQKPPFPVSLIDNNSDNSSETMESTK